MIIIRDTGAQAKITMNATPANSVHLERDCLTQINQTSGVTPHVAQIVCIGMTINKFRDGRSNAA
jgi:hypothetical protein